MSLTQGGAVDHRAAAAALDRITDLLARRAELDTELAQAARDALTLPGVSQAQVAHQLGITARGLRKRLAG